MYVHSAMLHQASTDDKAPILLVYDHMCSYTFDQHRAILPAGTLAFAESTIAS